jgi:tartrate dehydratase beta subunit/fumarate hydratase class I family protein
MHVSDCGGGVMGLECPEPGMEAVWWIEVEDVPPFM